jgi:hypothetical protein
MSTNLETDDIHLENKGRSRSDSSDAVTLARYHYTDKEDNNGSKASENHDLKSEHTAADTEEKPKKKNNIFITFSGLQLALFLAALDRYSTKKIEKEILQFSD